MKLQSEESILNLTTKKFTTLAKPALRTSSVFILIVALLLSCSRAAEENSNDTVIAETEDEVDDEYDFLNHTAQIAYYGDFFKSTQLKRSTTDSVELEIYTDAVLEFINIADAANESQNLEDSEEIVLESTHAVLAIDWPLDKPVEIEVQSQSESGFSRLEMILLICDNYRRIYDEEEETSTIKVIPREERISEKKRNTTDGKYGIWGHDLIDLVLFGFEVWLDEGTYYVYPEISS